MYWSILKYNLKISIKKAKLVMIIYGAPLML